MHGIYIDPAIDDAGLTPIQLRIWIHLRRRGGKNEIANPAIPSIATTCRVSDPTVKRTTKWLEENGWLDVQHRAGGKNQNIYVCKVPHGIRKRLRRQGNNGVEGDVMGSERSHDGVDGITEIPGWDHRDPGDGITEIHKGVQGKKYKEEGTPEPPSDLVSFFEDVDQTEGKLFSIGALRKVDAETADRVEAIGELFGRHAEMGWVPAELAAFRARRLQLLDRDAFWSDLGKLKRYYGMKLPPGASYRRGSLLALLENWPDDVSNAEQRCEQIEVLIRAQMKHIDPSGLGGARPEAMLEVLRPGGVLETGVVGKNVFGN